MDFLRPDYLRTGTARQRAAYAALTRLRVFDRLAPYTPVLAGTLPLGVDTPASDIDVLCAAYDLDTFATVVRSAFGAYAGFALHQAVHQDLLAVIARFEAFGFPIELFGQPRPVTEQQGYRHLLAEARLLALACEPARTAIRGLKRQGLKTEPAFARHFALSGDPYTTLLALADAPDAELGAIVARRAELSDLNRAPGGS